ncbi:MAG: 50S ribosomal protein L15 [Phycisphaerales bacterium]|nr:50S ribosomal protein L15 [Phycisphaerales bacterium]
MMIHDVTAKVGKHKRRMRVGRGEGSGKGGTSGRGHKGAKSRAGWTSRPGYQGGSTPLLRRFPKRGFSNADFRADYHIVNVGDFASHFTAGGVVDLDALIKLGFVRDSSMPLKVLGNGVLAAKLTVTADRFSAQAKSKIESVGGTATLTQRGARTNELDAVYSAKAAKLTARSKAKVADVLAKLDAKAAAAAAAPPVAKGAKTVKKDGGKAAGGAKKPSGEHKPKAKPEGKQKPEGDSH